MFHVVSWDGRADFSWVLFSFAVFGVWRCFLGLAVGCFLIGSRGLCEDSDRVFKLYRSWGGGGGMNLGAVPVFL